MELPDVLAKHPIADSAAHEKLFEGNFSQLQKWVNTTDQKYVLLHIRRERRRGNYGESLKLLEKNISSSGSNFWLFKKRRDIYEKLGWQHLWEYERRWLMIRFPAQTKFF
jgi:tripeptidyl-peptidase-2